MRSPFSSEGCDVSRRPSVAGSLSRRRRGVGLPIKGGQARQPGHARRGCPGPPSRAGAGAGPAPPPASVSRTRPPSSRRARGGSPGSFRATTLYPRAHPASASRAAAPGDPQPRDQAAVSVRAALRIYEDRRVVPLAEQAKAAWPASPSIAAARPHRPRPRLQQDFNHPSTRLAEPRLNGRINRPGRHQASASAWPHPSARPAEGMPAMHHQYLMQAGTTTGSAPPPSTAWPPKPAPHTATTPSPLCCRA